MALHTCQAVCDFVQHCEASSMLTLLKSWPLQYFQHFLLFKNCGSWTLSCDFAHTINETLKCLTQLPTLMQSHSGGDSVASIGGRT